MLLPHKDLLCRAVAIPYYIKALAGFALGNAISRPYSDNRLASICVAIIKTYRLYARSDGCLAVSLQLILAENYPLLCRCAVAIVQFGMLKHAKSGLSDIHLCAYGLVAAIVPCQPISVGSERAASHSKGHVRSVGHQLELLC
mgnify:CR=1 FL=1